MVPLLLLNLPITVRLNNCLSLKWDTTRKARRNWDTWHNRRRRKCKHSPSHPTRGVRVLSNNHHNNLVILSRHQVQGQGSQGQGNSLSRDISGLINRDSRVDRHQDLRAKLTNR